MVVNSVGTLVDVLTQYRFLLPWQQQELSDDLQDRFEDARALAREMLHRGWLTPYQVNLLLQGRVEELTLGPYLLLQRLSEGADQVFKAKHRIFNRVVALRVIRR